MPMYTYICPECGTSRDVLLPMNLSDDPLECVCGGDMRRKFNVGMVWSPTANGGYSV